ncbi:carboxylate-amine ligase [Rhodovibrio salinarum]|uniref:Putative glutamate--cysteine ligase 2 n=1 Tax=Rhodovibrio salinarum TaxID=1087 RepID=A0A934QEJ4_9PROT|nr:carboxylate-amine ligase [Rhodovibrio salinarum]MBK1695812.1 carboxylate-amine ligase [Rhodovibrio salinarum]
MSQTVPSFTMGVEEEYLLVERQSRDLVTEVPDALMAECERRLKSRVSPEFLRCQIEVGTGVNDTLHGCREELRELRRTVADVVNAYDLAPIAASTHPFAAWTSQKHTDKERYNVLARDMQAVARRMIICAMHVHVGIEDDELRMDLMGQAAYFLPHLLALSTSSPFWRGENTGLKSYRLAVFDELPRTGLPEMFESWSEYQRHLAMMVEAGLIEDASKIWWDVRPSARFPTLELRITDVTPRLDDGICIAAIFVCLLRMLYRLKRNNQRWRRYANILVRENRWRAQRYGFDEGLVDFGRGELLPYSELLEELLDLIRPEAEEMGVLAEVSHAREIVRHGTSAHRQLKVYHDALAEGADTHTALQQVVDMLARETLIGV